MEAISHRIRVIWLFYFLIIGIMMSPVSLRELAVCSGEDLVELEVFGGTRNLSLRPAYLTVLFFTPLTYLHSGIDLSYEFYIFEFLNELNLKLKLEVGYVSASYTRAYYNRAV